MLERAKEVTRKGAYTYVEYARFTCFPGTARIYFFLAHLLFISGRVVSAGCAGSIVYLETLLASGYMRSLRRFCA